MNNKYFIPLKLPSLNDYTSWCRGNKYLAAKKKAQIEEQIGGYIEDMPKWSKPIKIHFHWIESNKRRDLDNIAFAKKFILDALVKYGKLSDDNRKCVYAFTDSFEYGCKAGIVLEVEEKNK